MRVRELAGLLRKNKMECPFCKIDEERTKIICEGKYTFVLLSNPRLMKGHTLIIPKRHVENLIDLNLEERKELFEKLFEFYNKILKKLARDCDIRCNYRPFQKQNNLKVNHLHIHLQPRELFDELYEKCQKFEKNIFKDLTKEEKEEVYNLFLK